MNKRLEALLADYKGLLRSIVGRSFPEYEAWDWGFTSGEEEMLIKVIIDIEDILSLTKRND